MGRADLDPRYDFDIVFEGGGAKGAAFVGAMHEFQARNYRFRRLVGTSAGAIQATLLAAGFSAAELQAAVLERHGDASVLGISNPTRHPGWHESPLVYREPITRSSRGHGFVESSGGGRWRAR